MRIKSLEDGTLYTSDRHAEGKAELVVFNVPAPLRKGMRKHLRLLQGREVLATQLVGDPSQPILVTATTPAERQALMDKLQDVSPEADVLVLRPVTPVSTCEGEEKDLYVKRLGSGMARRDCSCAPVDGACPCAKGLMAVYRALNGQQVFTGLVATTNGFKRLHANAHDLYAPGHIVTAAEFQFTMSKYDNASAVVIPISDTKYVRRSVDPEAVLDEALALVEREIVETANTSGFLAELAPAEVRFDDTVALCLQKAPCCDRTDCKVRIGLFEVLAVHHDDKSLVVYDTDQDFPMRIPHDMVLGTVRGPHWLGTPNGLSDDDD